MDSNPRGPTQVVGYGLSPRLRAELQGWEHLPEVAVLDELLMNVDRTWKNLHRVAPEQFILIDHEKILGGPQWKLDALKKRMMTASSANHIATFIAESTPGETRNRMIQIGVDYATNVEFTEQSLNIDCDQLDSLCRLQPGTTAQILKLIDQRRKKLPNLLFHHLQMEQLLQ